MIKSTQKLKEIAKRGMRNIADRLKNERPIAAGTLFLKCLGESIAELKKTDATLNEEIREAAYKIMHLKVKGMEVLAGGARASVSNGTNIQIEEFDYTKVSDKLLEFYGEMEKVVTWAKTRQNAFKLSEGIMFKIAWLETSYDGCKIRIESNVGRHRNEFIKDSILDSVKFLNDLRDLILKERSKDYEKAIGIIIDEINSVIDSSKEKSTIQNLVGEA